MTPHWRRFLVTHCPQKSQYSFCSKQVESAILDLAGTKTTASISAVVIIAKYVQHHLSTIKIFSQIFAPMTSGACMVNGDEGKAKSMHCNVSLRWPEQAQKPAYKYLDLVRVESWKAETPTCRCMTFSTLVG